MKVKDIIKKLEELDPDEELITKDPATENPGNIGRRYAILSISLNDVLFATQTWTVKMKGEELGWKEGLPWWPCGVRGSILYTEITEEMTIDTDEGPKKAIPGKHVLMYDSNYTHHSKPRVVEKEIFEQYYSPHATEKKWIFDTVPIEK